MTAADKMPPMPRALCRDDTVHDADYFTADQMHAYARQHAAAEVAAVAGPLVEALWRARWVLATTEGANAFAALQVVRAALASFKETQP